MGQTNIIHIILEEYRKGKRHFENLDIENESFNGQDLRGIIFDGCRIYADFRKANLQDAQFLNGGVKTCDFREADLTNAHFENVCIESTQFARSKTTGIYFDNNSAYGQNVTQSEFEEWIKNTEDNA